MTEQSFQMQSNRTFWNEKSLIISKLFRYYALSPRFNCEWKTIMIPQNNFSEQKFDPLKGGSKELISSKAITSAHNRGFN